MVKDLIKNNITMIKKDKSIPEIFEEIQDEFDKLFEGISKPSEQ